MTFRFPSLIVTCCLLSAAQLLGTSSTAIAADALFGRPLITDVIDETRLVKIVNSVPMAFNVARSVETPRSRGTKNGAPATVE